MYHNFVRLLYRCDEVIDEYARNATAVCCAWGELTTKVSVSK